MPVSGNDQVYNVFPEVNPNGIYTHDQLKNLWGRKTIEKLRKHGLVAICNRYLGENVKQAWMRAADAEHKRRCGLGEGGHDEETTQNEGMEEGCVSRNVQYTGKPGSTESIQEQLERHRRETA